MDVPAVFLSEEGRRALEVSEQAALTRTKSGKPEPVVAEAWDRVAEKARNRVNISDIDNNIATKQTITRKMEKAGEEPCRKCGKIHEPKEDKDGNAWGDSKKLRKSIEKNRKNTKDEKSLKEHPWNHGDSTLEAHHLVSSAILKETPKWAVICAATGYNINHWKNGVLLPYKLEAACQLRTPLHRGNHEEGKGDPNMTYPQSVNKLVRPILKSVNEGNLCVDDESIMQDLDNVSLDVLNEIASFRWTITVDGRDYQQGKNGCCGVRSGEGALADKRKKEHTKEQLGEKKVYSEGLNKCPYDRNHGLKQIKTEKKIKSRTLKIGH